MLIRVNQAYDYNKKTSDIFAYEHILEQASKQLDYVVAGNSVYVDHGFSVHVNLLLQVEQHRILPQGVTNITYDKTGFTR